jgi:hypothetical protein
MNILRKHWLLILFIAIEMLWWPIFILLYPSRVILDRNASFQNIDYWSVVINPERTWIAIAGFIVIGIIVFIKIWRISGFAVRLALIVGMLFSCGFFIYINWPTSLESSWNIRHVMSAQYQGKIYQLAVGDYSKPFDISFPTYYVFECDEAGRMCSLIQHLSILVYDSDDDQLIMSDNKLILDRKFAQIQILPMGNCGTYCY